MTTYQVDECTRMTKLFESATAFGRWQGRQLFLREISSETHEKRVQGFVRVLHHSAALTMTQRIALCVHAFEAADDYAASQRPVRLGSALMLGTPEHYSSL